MVIECKSCSRKFNLDENLLKPAGSRVQCSKCGTIFHACPAPISSHPNPTREADGMAEDPDQGQCDAPFFEKRKYPRVPVSIPVLCDAIDLEGKPCDIHVSAIKEISQTGLAIELFTTTISEQVSLNMSESRSDSSWRPLSDSWWPLTRILSNRKFQIAVRRVFSSNPN